MTEYNKLNQIVVLNSAAVLEMVYLLEQINVASGIWYVALNLVNVFFSILFRKEDQKTFISI